MEKLVDVIIMCKDRGGQRLVNCIESLRSKHVAEIIVVDYGSKIPIKEGIDTPKEMDNVKIIRYDDNPIMNKSHAINLGIKHTHSEYICTVDCDMILHPKFICEAMDLIDSNTFIYTLNTRRVEIEDICDDFEEMLKSSRFWFEVESRDNLTNQANGGIQFYPRKWIEKVGGCDENLIYWGAMDNDIFERATLSKLKMVNINMPLIHQEHENTKEDNLPENERIFASKVREMKVHYLEEKFISKDIIRNEGKWGECEPNQDFFLKKKETIVESYRKVSEGIKEALDLGRNYFFKDGNKYFIQVARGRP